MLEAAELVEKTILGNVICEETAADDTTDDAADVTDDATDDANPEVDEAAGTEAVDELSTKLLKLLVESSEADEVALVM